MDISLLKSESDWRAVLALWAEKLTAEELEGILGAHFSLEELIVLRDFSPVTIKYLDALIKKATIKPNEYPCVVSSSLWEGTDTKESFIKFYYAQPN